MARLEDTIAEIADASVRQAIADELAKLKMLPHVGLVFHEFQPDVAPLHGARRKRAALRADRQFGRILARAGAACRTGALRKERRTS